MRDIVNNNFFLHRTDDIAALLSLITYMRLQEVFHNYRNNSGTPTGISMPLEDFFRSFKRGSKKIRNILERDRFIKHKANQLSAVRTFFGLIGENLCSDTELHKILGLWGLNSLSNKHREFAYKFSNNLLGINTRTAHFVDNTDRSCTFCKENNVPWPSPETFVHLFFECPFTSAIQTHFAVKYLPELQLSTASEKKNFWFCGISPTRTVGGGIFLNIISSTLMFTICEQKLNKNKLSIATIENNFFFFLGKIFEGNSEFRENIMSLNLSLCRNWDEYRGRRG